MKKSPIRNGHPTDLLLVFGSILGCLLVLELGVRLNDYYGYGDRRPLSERIAAEASSYNRGIHAPNVFGAGCAWVDHVYPHPYLGYVKHPFPPCRDAMTGASGFSGAEYPTRKEPGTFVLLLTGGSVAEGQIGRKSDSNLLENELNAHYRGNGIERYKVISAAVGAWKQPQQLIAFALSSDIVDGVVTLDGYNEFTSVTAEGPDVYFDRPLMSIVPGGPNDYIDLSILALEWTEGTIRRGQMNSWLFRHSHLAYDGAERARNRIRLAINARRSRSSSIPFHPLGLDVAPAEAKTPERNIERYTRYIKLMDAISSKFGIRELHAIQPVPAIGKQLTSEEVKVVGSLYYASVYQGIANAINSLSREKIPICDLLQIFRDNHRSLYTDRIHVTPEGQAGINAGIVHCLEKSWGLRRTS